MSVRLLCLGDLHLGRAPGGLRSDDGSIGGGGGASRLGPPEVLRRCVEWALRERPDAVLFAGDVVDSSNARFEAFGPLHRAVEQLVDAGMAVVGVAGNHDVQALPALAAKVPGFHLLGAGGIWEIFPLQRDGNTVARLVGWSFGRPQVRRSPLPDLDLDALLPADGVPALGLLHCDLDASDSPYAPVSRAALSALLARREELRGWLLGHVHAPSLGEQGELLGYLGSVTPLDAGEPGPHGPWLVTLEAGAGTPRREQLLLAPVRWERLEIDVSAEPELAGDLAGGDPDMALLDLIAERVRERAAALGDDLAQVQLVCWRVCLVGESAAHRQLAAAARKLGRAATLPVGGDVQHVLDRVDSETRPRRDLPSLARSGDPVGLLSRHLLALEQDHAPEWLPAARRALEQQQRQPAFGVLDHAPAALQPGPDGDQALRDLLLRAGRDALEELLAQRQEGP